MLNPSFSTSLSLFSPIDSLQTVIPRTLPSPKFIFIIKIKLSNNSILRLYHQPTTYKYFLYIILVDK